MVTPAFAPLSHDQWRELFVSLFFTANSLCEAVFFWLHMMGSNAASWELNAKEKAKREGEPRRRKHAETSNTFPELLGPLLDPFRGGLKSTSVLEAEANSTLPRLE